MVICVGYMIALLLIVADFVLLLCLLLAANSTGAQFIIHMLGGCLIVSWGDRTAWATHLSSSRTSTHITLYTCSHHPLTCSNHTAHLLMSYTHLLTSCSTPAHIIHTPANIIHTSHVIHTPAHIHTCSHHAAHLLILFNRLSGGLIHM